MSTVGGKLLSSLLYDGDPKKFGKFGLQPTYFTETELPVYSFVLSHIQSFGKLPDPQTAIDQFGSGVIFEVPEPPEFYSERVKKRFLYTTMKSLVLDVGEKLKEDEVETAFGLLKDGVSGLFLEKHGMDISDMRSLNEIVYKEYIITKQSVDGLGLHFGWPSLDAMSGGLMPGDLCTLLGRPSCQSGQSNLFVSRDGGKTGSWLTLEQLYQYMNREPADNTQVHAHCLMGGSIGFNLVEQAIECGAKETWTLTTRSGCSIRTTKEHKFLTESGEWKELGSINKEDLIMLGGLDDENRLWSDKMKTITHHGKEETYDLVMKDPYNNYVSDGFVTHNSGKTFVGLHIANNIWKAKHSILFISMEMSATLISQRIAAMVSHKNLTQLMKAMLSTKAFNDMMTVLTGLTQFKHPFWLVDGKLSSSIDDVLLLSNQLHPECVIVDGAYLLQCSDKRLSRWDRLTSNAEALKQRVATNLGVPVIASYQFSRSKETSKKSKKGLDDVYGTDAVAQLSSICLGLMEDETIQTQKQRSIEVLKGRSGEIGAVLINWDFYGVDFSEVAKDDSDIMYL